ncbi:MAG: hypothetical protein WDO73_25170 [Ignavibacteriota bacterium]
MTSKRRALRSYRQCIDRLLACLPFQDDNYPAIRGLHMESLWRRPTSTQLGAPRGFYLALLLRGERNPAICGLQIKGIWRRPARSWGAKPKTPRVT